MLSPCCWFCFHDPIETQKRLPVAGPVRIEGRLPRWHRPIETIACESRTQNVRTIAPVAGDPRGRAVGGDGRKGRRQEAGARHGARPCVVVVPVPRFVRGDVLSLSGNRSACRMSSRAAAVAHRRGPPSPWHSPSGGGRADGLGGALRRGTNAAMPGRRTPGGDDRLRQGYWWNTGNHEWTRMNTNENGRDRG